MNIPVYGVEDVLLDNQTGLLYVNPTLSETAPLHTHSFYEFFVVTSGSALHLINSSIQTISFGDFIFIRPKDVHCYDFYHSEDFQIENVGFGIDHFESIEKFLHNTEKMNPLIESSSPPYVHLSEADTEAVKKAFQVIGKLIQAGPSSHAICHAKSILALMFSDYFFSYEGNLSAAAVLPSWLSNLLLEMQKIENLQKGFTKMLSLSSYTKNHLCRVMKAYLQMTPTEYINEKRLDYAVYLLTQTSYEIIEISELCGFHNLSHFYHLFKSNYQCSPLKFRSTHKPSI